MQIVIQVEQLFIKGWIVRQSAYGIVVNMQAVGHGFHGNGFLPVGNQPMKWRGGQLRTECFIRQIDPREELPYFRNCGALG